MSQERRQIVNYATLSRLKFLEMLPLVHLVFLKIGKVRLLVPGGRGDNKVKVASQS